MVCPFIASPAECGGYFDRRTDLFASAKTQDENDESHNGTGLLGSVASFVKNLRRKRRITQKDRPFGEEWGARRLLG